MTWHGSLFQTHAAAIGKARSPTSDIRVRTIRKEDYATEDDSSVEYWKNSSARYDDAVPSFHANILNVRTANLYWLLWSLQPMSGGDAERLSRCMCYDLTENCKSSCLSVAWAYLDGGELRGPPPPQSKFSCSVEV